MAAINGQRVTSNISADQRVIDIADTILLLEPSATPLTVVSKRIGKGKLGPAQDSSFHWLDDKGYAHFGEVDGAHNDSVTSIKVADLAPFYTASLVMNTRTGELLRVVGIDEGNSEIDVATRGSSGSSAAAMNNEDVLFVLGSVAEEGTGAPVARSDNPVKTSNYTQTWKNSIAASGTLLSSANQVSPHDWRHQHKKVSIEHLLQIEYSALFGKPSESNGPNGNKVRTTGGVLHYYTHNVKGVGGALTRPVLDEWVRGMSEYGSDTLTVFASPLVLDAINSFALGRVQVVNPNQKTFGLKIMQYQSPNGTLNLVRHPKLIGEFSGYAIAVDFKASESGFRPLSGRGAPGGSRDTRLKQNVQAPDLDGRIDQWLTEGGFQWRLPETGGVLTGVTGAA